MSYPDIGGSGGRALVAVIGLTLGRLGELTENNKILDNVKRRVKTLHLQLFAYVAIALSGHCHSYRCLICGLFATRSTERFGGAQLAFRGNTAGGLGDACPSRQPEASVHRLPDLAGRRPALVVDDTGTPGLLRVHVGQGQVIYKNSESIFWRSSLFEKTGEHKKTA